MSDTKTGKVNGEKLETAIEIAIALFEVPKQDAAAVLIHMATHMMKDKLESSGGFL